MEKREAYIEVLLRNALNCKKDDSLFVSISTNNKEFVDVINKKTKEIGINDIHIFYNNAKHKDNHLSEYIEKNAKFLFFTSENKDDLNMNMVNDIINNDVNIDYTIAVMPSKAWAEKTVKTHKDSKKILENALYYFSSIDEENPVISWNKLISDNKKRSSSIKNLKLNMVVISDVNGNNLRFAFKNDIKGNSEYNRMKLFPNYMVELLPVDGTTQGFIDATNIVRVNNTDVEELRISIKDGEVVDYDCTSGASEIKKVLDVYPKPVISAVGLIDKDDKTYNKFHKFHNVVLDRTSNPYILISSYNKELDENYSLIVPIGSSLLKVSGYNESSKDLVIYEEEGFSKKIMPNKK